MSLIFGRRAWNLRAKSVPLFCLDGWINNLRCLFGFFVRMPGQKIGLTMLTTNFLVGSGGSKSSCFLWAKMCYLEVSLPIISNGSFSCSLSFAPASGGIFDLPAFHLFFGVFRSHRGLSEGTEKNPRKFPPFWNAHGWGCLHWSWKREISCQQFVSSLKKTNLPVPMTLHTCMSHISQDSGSMLRVTVLLSTT